MKRLLFLALILSSLSAGATHFKGIYAVDRDHLMVAFQDGEVRYRDDGTGKSAYLGHTFVEGDDTLYTFLPRLNTQETAIAGNWSIASEEDANYKKGLKPSAVYRKSKPMHTDNRLISELDHWLYLRLPEPMQEGCTYTVTIPGNSGSDTSTASITYSIWTCQSEAVHVNLNGYSPVETSMAADLYLWLGDGGPRDYGAYEGRKVWLLDTETGEKKPAGEVKFWKKREDSRFEAGGKDLTGSPVWDISFRETRPGTYRLVVDGVGCSMDFRIAPDVYRLPYQYSVRGYYYMRIGEPMIPEVTPPARQPSFIPGEDPKGLKVYLSELHPWHPDWRKNKGDVWDEPHFKKKEQSSFWAHRPKGFPTNEKAVGGHSDAMDWDRHLAHVSNIYDILLPFILSGGALSEDNLGIRESGNGIPDLIDEARNEVDFFLSIRDPQGGYSQGVTNPDKDWTVMFQAGSTTMAAWANSANCAILAQALELAGKDSLCRYYTEEAIKAYRYAQAQSWTQLDDFQGIGQVSMRGRDFRQMAAAFLYNLTGEAEWENAFAADVRFPITKEGRNGWCQLWAAAAYLSTSRTIHYPKILEAIKTSIAEETDSKHLAPSRLRPSRRGANDPRWQTSENLQTVMLAHFTAGTPERKEELARLMFGEAGWCLGRNPGNIVEMTGLGTRHITDVYAAGRNDGSPGTHPGQTPFNGTECWSEGNGGDVPILLRQCYPAWNNWPKQESYFNQRYFWANSEFTPRETMRGKMALTAYLYWISTL